MKRLSLESELLYMQVYYYFQKQIADGSLAAGSKMPSLRRWCTGAGAKPYHHRGRLSPAGCRWIYHCQTAERLLCDRPGQPAPDHTRTKKDGPLRQSVLIFPLPAWTGKAFASQLWRRYLKSALRQDERLLTYGSPQGEEDFREVLADYVRKHRNILCKPQDIVVGAGVRASCTFSVRFCARKKPYPFPRIPFSREFPCSGTTVLKSLIETKTVTASMSLLLI